MSEELRPQIGKHAAYCRSIQFGYTSKDGEQVAIGFEIVDEADPDHGVFVTYFGGFGEPKDGKKNGPVTFTMQALRNVGWTGDDLSELPALAEVGELNQLVWLVVEHEEYESKWSAKVKWVNKPGGGAVEMKKPMGGSDLKAFAARMKSRLRADVPRVQGAAPRATPNGGGAKPPSHPNAPGSVYGNGAPAVDDDIPF